MRDLTGYKIPFQIIDTKLRDFSEDYRKEGQKVSKYFIKIRSKISVK